jgi:hypothetical protein
LTPSLMPRAPWGRKPSTRRRAQWHCSRRKQPASPRHSMTSSMSRSPISMVEGRSVTGSWSATSGSMRSTRSHRIATTGISSGLSSTTSSTSGSPWKGRRRDGGYQSVRGHRDRSCGGNAEDEAALIVERELARKFDRSLSGVRGQGHLPPSEPFLSGLRFFHNVSTDHGPNRFGIVAAAGVNAFVVDVEYFVAILRCACRRTSP